MGTPPFQLWSHLEERFSRTGEVPSGTDSNETLFRSIVRSNNARTSEALVIQKKADPLLALRAYVYRGRFKEASALADQLSQAADTSVRSCEVLLEQARIMALEGEWIECERLCSHALSLPEIAPVSQLTIFQIRALARFETSQMSGAVSDLAQIDSLATLFPNSPSAFYASVLRAKIIARDRSPEAGFLMLERLWEYLVHDSNACLDRVHALIRSELDLERLTNHISPARLLASYRIAEITGEDLYLALAALEAAHSGIKCFTEHFGPVAHESARTFPKVRKLLEEIAGKSNETSVSGATLSAASQAIHEVNDSEMATLTGLIHELQKTATIFLVKRGALIHLSPFSLFTLDGQPQLKKAVLALSEGAIPMSVFFSKLWGRQRYSPDLHAGLISSLLYRLRKKTGLSARIVAGEIRLENTLVLP